MAGLSPCVRGTLIIAGSEFTKPRFIPVCTGNTPSISERAIRSPVYPRVYGEHSSKIITTGWILGLSPCVRGTLA